MVDIFKKVASVLGKMFSIEILLRTLKLPSAMLLIIVNLIPIFGVIVLKWNPYDVIFLYWFENIVIGIFNFLRILLAKSVASSYLEENKVSVAIHGAPSNLDLFGKGMNIFFAFFFLVHYGMFTFVHGMFLGFLVLNKTSFVINSDYTGIIVFFIALMISHGFSFFSNYIGKKEYLETDVKQQMMAPYGRVMIIQFTIIFGGLLAFFAPSFFMIIFIVFKILFDLSAHLNVHTVKHKLEEDIANINTTINFVKSEEDTNKNNGTPT